MIRRDRKQGRGHHRHTNLRASIDSFDSHPERIMLKTPRCGWTDWDNEEERKEQREAELKDAIVKILLANYIFNQKRDMMTKNGVLLDLVYILTTCTTQRCA